MLCSLCGWEYPPTFTGSKCKICQTLLPEQFCTICKRKLSLDDFELTPKGIKGYCKDCTSKINKEARQKRFELRFNKAKNLYEEWLKKVSHATDQRLSETDWQKTCRRFKGCSICGNPHIEIKGFFIPFKDGGKYAAWNIIPLCYDCSLRIGNRGPFAYFSDLLLNTGNREMALNEDILLNITKYLEKCLKGGV